MTAGGAPDGAPPDGAPPAGAPPAGADDACAIDWLPRRRRPGRIFPEGRSGYRVAVQRMPTGERIRLVELGPRTSPPVVLAHGWGASAFAWRETIEALAAAGWRVVAPDLRGHGFSEKPDDPRLYTSAALTDHLLAIMDAAGVERAPLVAHSLGAEAALGAALQAPERVSRLVLIAPVGLGHVALAFVGRLLTPAFLTRVLTRLLGPWSVRLALFFASARMRWQAEVIEQHAAPLAQRGFAAATRHLLHGALWRRRLPSELARVRVPVLVIVGTKDRLVPTRGLDEWCALLPNARAERVEGAGHVLPEEAAERVNPLVIEFLAPELEGGNRGPGIGSG